MHGIASRHQSIRETQRLRELQKLISWAYLDVFKTVIFIWFLFYEELTKMIALRKLGLDFLYIRQFR